MLLVALLPAVAGAQMPGLPVLQNAWANPGFTVAANGATGKAEKALAAAVSWAPRSARFQVSGGVGIRDADLGGRGGTYGARISVPAFSFANGSLGIAGFVGIGAAQVPDARILPTDEPGGSVAHVPAGVAIGYRRAFSFIRGASVYAAPFYSYNRLSVGDSTVSRGAFRYSFGVDVGVTNRLGVTGGAEFGGSSDSGPGPRGASFGLGVSLKLGRSN